jgi:glycerol 3-phosphatase-2
VAVAAVLARYDTILLDLDGCVWVGDEALPGSAEAIAALRGDGRRIGFVTNDARLTDDELVRKLWRLGIRAAREEVISVGGALQYALATSPHATAYVVGAPAVHRHVTDAGLRIVNGSDLAERADVVVLAGHERFAYDELTGAVRAALRGAELVCTSRDTTFPSSTGPLPATGAIVAAVEYASGRAAVSVGKPETAIFEAALDRLGGANALMVGDRLDADVAGARAAGLATALVLSGSTGADEAAAADPAPDHLAATLGELVLR